MRKLISLLVLHIIFISTLLGQDQDVAFSINGNPTYKSELQKDFTESQLYLDEGNKESVSAFLEGYILRKMAIEEAYNQRIDSTLFFKRELSSYEIQLTNAMLQDTVSVARLGREILKRYESELEVNHILVPFTKEVLLPKDTVDVYKEALAVREVAIKQGFDKVEVTKLFNSFGIIVDVESETGYLGWIRPSMFPLKLDEIIYSLKLHEITMPIRGSKGYHIFQVIGKRPLQGTPVIEQVMFNFPIIPATKEIQDSVYQVAIKTYDEITIKGNFQEICDEFATTFDTGERGCLLGAIGVDEKVPSVLIAKAYSMVNVGEVSEPILSEYGYHILRLKDKLAPPTKQDVFAMASSIVNSATAYPELHRRRWREMMTQNDGVINKEAYKKLELLAEIYNPKDTIFSESATNKSDVLFTIEGIKEYTVDEFLEYMLYMNWLIRPAEKSGEGLQGDRFETIEKFTMSTDVLDENLKNFTFMILSNYEKATLAEKNPKYAQTIKKLSDDLMYTTFKDKEVWTKSKIDGAGLEALYLRNKKNYSLDGEYFKGIIVHCKDEKTLSKIKKGYPDKQSTSKDIKKKYNQKEIIVQTLDGLWKQGDNPYVDTEVYKNGSKAAQRSFPYYTVLGEFISTPQDYTDVRSQVERDYQIILEQEWKDNLKKKYTVQLNEAVINKIK